MPAADPAPGVPRRRARWRLNLPPWWLLARNVGLLGLGVAAVGGWVNGLIDEIGENRTGAALVRQNDRQAYEQECRFDLAQPVAELEARQIDILVDLAIARARGDAAALQVGLDQLAQLRVDKAEAVADRAGAVEECSSRASALFGPGA